MVIVTAAAGWIPWSRPRPLPEISYPVVFVVGCPRSGTTWVESMLARHPRVIGGCESHVYPVVHRSLDQRNLRSLGGWSRLLYAVDRGVALGRPVGIHHYVDRRSLVALARDSLARGGGSDRTARLLTRAIFDAHYLRSGGTGQEVLVEKTPLHIGWVDQIIENFPDARFVEVVRDGRDVCVSMEMIARANSAFSSSRTAQITTWCYAVRTGIALRGDPGYRDRMSRVRYEDLKADPAGELDRLFGETGIGGDEDAARGAAAATEIRHYPLGKGHFRFRGVAGSWREHFTSEDVALFREMVGDLFVEAGYDYDD